MSKLQLFRVFLNERLTAAAVEIFEALEQTVAEYHKENDRLRRLLRITPEIQLRRIGSCIDILIATVLLSKYTVRDFSDPQVYHVL